MLVSVSLILMVGMSMGWLCQKCRLPSLLGMLATGMVLGPYVLNLLDGSILGISPELRKMALIIILTRAGLGLDTSGLKKLGRPAVLMCFVPASFELMGVLLLAPKLMGLTVLEAAILGAVLAAVSPAVVVPRMVRLMDILPWSAGNRRPPRSRRQPGRPSEWSHRYPPRRGSR